MKPRVARTIELLNQIQATTSEAEKQNLAWEVVKLNGPAATWLARRFCPHPDEDDISDARISLYDAALYCDPTKGSSYISVACWYYMRRTTGKRNAAGIHVPANLAQLTSKIRAWLKIQHEKTGVTPSIREARAQFQLGLSDEDLHVVLWAVGNPKADRAVLLDPSHEDFESGSGALHNAVASEIDAEMPGDLENLSAALNKLSPFEKAAVLSYGGGATSTLRVIGEEFGVSREWVNQTRKRVLGQLRHMLHVPNAVKLNDAM
jgi:RNA polymerase sigma factor (sigma-70 family)